MLVEKPNIVMFKVHHANNTVTENWFV